MTELVCDLTEDPASSPSELGDIVAIGGEVTADTILQAYARGTFPMAMAVSDSDAVDVGAAADSGDDELEQGGVDEHSVLAWWSPIARGVLPLDRLRVTRSLAKSCRRFHVTVNRDFDAVLRACADPGRDGTWLEDDFLAAYRELHHRGHAHSLETRTDSGTLVGGLICVEQGGLVNGDSMFHWQRDASKVALVELVRLLRAAPAVPGLPAWLGGRVLDVQWTTNHLASLGAVEMTRRDYVRMLPTALSAVSALSASA